MFFKIGFLKYSTKFLRKRLCWNLFLINLQASRPATLLKRNSSTGFSCEFGEIFKDTFFAQHLRTTVSVKLKDKTVKEREERRCNKQLAQSTVGL